ncbi:hypothetical protein SUGI_0233530 [Cryptomeria japonica]|uniref:probable E3 ubiquitin-protein ligase BAH1-like 1 n=1 Tax=Cryptomeria japonica TaxID=3369 RepID=UPI002408DA00|nr:probable E3 ubiquitin-protein ligase BAH1-like 1 [Cryptomeria japonica]GLJ14442.1 hypothetical protein SUGI_0233530 [Cryptomeria japonica]
MKSGRLLKGYFYIDYKRLKALMKECIHRKRELETLPNVEAATTIANSESAQHCIECERFFVKEVNRQISAVIGCFNLHAKNLLHHQISSDLRRYLWRARYLFADYQQRRIAQAQKLISYAATNAKAINKLLVKYSKVHCSTHTPHFKSRLHTEQLELLKSPWLIELCAFQINCSQGKKYTSEAWEACTYSIEFTIAVAGPSINCKLLESANLDFNLNCPICLDTAFEPIALGCGHIFCNSCACTSASVPTIAGVKAAKQKSMCPICRQMGVYANSVYLVQSGLLLKKRCREVWKERLPMERALRVKQAKEHWKEQSRLFLGV